MSWHSITVSMGWLAVASGVVGVSYQLRRVRELGVEGVSLATWVLFVYMGCFWITYGLAARSAEVVLGSVLMMPFQLSILFRLAPWRRWAVPARAFGYFVLCCVVPTLLWGWAGGVFGTGIAMTINSRAAAHRVDSPIGRPRGCRRPRGTSALSAACCGFSITRARICGPRSPRRQSPAWRVWPSRCSPRGDTVMRVEKW